MSLARQRRPAASRRPPAWLPAAAALACLALAARVQAQPAPDMTGPEPSANPGRAAPAAEDPATRRHVRSLLREGADCLKRDDPRGALDRFEAAFALTHNPKILFDHAIAYLQLGRDTDALTALDRFLVEAGGAPPLQRAQARRVQGELRGRLSSLEISGAATGATVTVDDGPAGALTASVPLHVTPGHHTVSVAPPDGSAPFVAVVDAVAGGWLELAAAFPGELGGAPPLATDASPSAPPEPARREASGPAPSSSGARAPDPLPLAVPPLGPPPPDALVAVRGAPAVAEIGAAPPARSSSSSSWWRRGAWIGVGAAALSSVGATAALLVADQRGAASRAYVAPNSYGACDRQLPASGGGDCAALIGSYDRYHDLAIGGYVAAGVLVTAAVALWLTDRGGAAP